MYVQNQNTNAISGSLCGIRKMFVFQVIFGTVCTQSISDARMRSSSKHARVAIIAGGIEYERQTNRFVAIDAVLRQEAEYLRNQTQRVLQATPTVVCVEKNVARTARAYFREANVTLVCNMKARALTRIARCTNAEVNCIHSHVQSEHFFHCR